MLVKISMAFTDRQLYENCQLDINLYSYKYHHLVGFFKILEIRLGHTNLILVEKHAMLSNPAG